MAAPDLETLLDFETNVENAAQIFLSTDTGLSTSSINLTLDQDDLVLPRIEVKFELGEALDPTDPKTTGSAELEYRKYTGTLNVIVMTRASKNGTDVNHRSYRAKVRKSLLLNANNFTTLDDGGPATILPYYDVNYLRPIGTDYTVDGNIAISALTFAMNLCIRNDAWPE